MFAPADAASRQNAATSRGGRTPSPYLTGNYTPLKKPCTEPTPCEVEGWHEEAKAWRPVAAGDLPEELRGAYLRTGPNPTTCDDPYDERYHWFDGDGLVHVVKLGADKVTFTCDYVKTAKYTVENRDPDNPVACFPRLLGDLRGPWEDIMSGLWIRAGAMIAAGVRGFKDGFGTANTAFTFFDDMLWVVNEADAPYWVVLDEDGKLSTAGRFDPFKWGLDKDVRAADVEPQLVIAENLLKKVMTAALLAMLANVKDWLKDDTTRLLLEKLMEGSMPFKKGKTFPITAHPKQLGGTGPLFVYGFDATGALADHLDYALLLGGGRPPLDQTSPILNADGGRAAPVFLHEFATTKEYLIFIDNPLNFGPRLKEDKFPFEHDKKRKFRLGVLHKANPGKGVVWYGPDPDQVSAAASSYIVFHLGNAWQDEDDSRVIKLYGMAFKEFEFEGMGKHVPQLVEFTLRVGSDFPQYTTKTIKDEKDRAFIGEFPKIPTRLTGLPTRYIYLVEGKVTVDGFCGILKVDVGQGKEHRRLELPKGGGGEAIFVPGKGSGKKKLEEDDGWLLMILTEVPEQPKEVEDDNSRESWLMIYSAKDLKPAYRIKLPVRVPYGIHGIHVTETQLAAARKQWDKYLLHRICDTAAPLIQAADGLQARIQTLTTRSNASQSPGQADAVTQLVQRVAKTVDQLTTQLQKLKQKV